VAGWSPAPKGDGLLLPPAKAGLMVISKHAKLDIITDTTIIRFFLFIIVTLSGELESRSD
jgi:hypothetical protein